MKCSSSIQSMHHEDIGKYVLEMNCLLGSGTYSKVYRGFVKKSKEPVAIKKINIEQLRKNRETVETIIQEAEMLKSLQHPNIIGYIALHQSPDKLHIYIITEYANQGTFKTLIINQPHLQTGDHAIGILSQITEGFKYMMSKFKGKGRRLIHRDIKPQNFLVHRTPDQLIYKIADFGFSRYIQSEDEMLTSILGTPLYMSPQIHMRENYTSKADIFSLGIMFFEIIYGKPPWNAKNPVQLLENIKNNPIETIIQSMDDKKTGDNNVYLCNLVIIKCLQYYEDERISWEVFFQLVEVVYDQRTITIPNVPFLTKMKTLIVKDLSHLSEWMSFISCQMLFQVNPLSTDYLQALTIVVYLNKVSGYILDILIKEYEYSQITSEQLGLDIEGLQTEIHMVMEIKILLEKQLKGKKEYEVILDIMDKNNFDINVYHCNLLVNYIEKTEQKQEEEDKYPGIGEYFCQVSLEWLLALLLELFQTYLLNLPESLQQDYAKTMSQMISMAQVLTIYGQKGDINLQQQIHQSYKNTLHFTINNHYSYKKILMALSTQQLQQQQHKQSLHKNTQNE